MKKCSKRSNCSKGSSGSIFLYFSNLSNFSQLTLPSPFNGRGVRGRGAAVVVSAKRFLFIFSGDEAIGRKDDFSTPISIIE